MVITAMRGCCVGWLLLLLMFSAGCSTNERHEISGETHWLAACSKTQDCARGECVCGMCTRICSGDADCSGQTPAQCFDVKSPGLQDHCDSAERSSGAAVCIATCKQDNDCPTRNACRAGACTPRAPASQVAGTPSVACASDDQCSAGEACVNLRCAVAPTAKATDFLGVDPGAIDLREPAQPPDPVLSIQGATDELIGTWVMDSGMPRYQIVIAREPGTQRTVGEVTRTEYGAGETFSGRDLAPPSDPDIGYPTNLDGQYSRVLRGGLPEYRYPLYDAQLSGHEFSAWYSHVELWSQWCAMQTPHRIEILGRFSYVCSPDIFDEKVDLGKRALCTSAEMSGCTAAVDNDGQPLSCKMPDSAQCMLEKQCVCTHNSELCSPAYCQCDAARCRANIWAAAIQLQLTLAGQRLQGTMLENEASTTDVTFRRATP